MGNRLICICNMVSEEEILAALRKGAKTTEEVQFTTCAGTSCGKCLISIDQIVEEYYHDKPQDPQQKLPFGS